MPFPSPPWQLNAQMWLSVFRVGGSGTADRPDGMYGAGFVSYEAGSALTYRELAERVDDLAVRLGTERRLVALAAANDLDSIVAYLAALVGGHPLILLPEDKPAALESLVAAYDPDVVMRPGDGGTVLEERRSGTRHELHPDLALLLSKHRKYQLALEAYRAVLDTSADDPAAWNGVLLALNTKPEAGFT